MLRTWALFFLIGFQGIVALSLFSQSNGLSDKTVLLLHSYNKGLQWTDNLNDAIVQEIDASEDYTTDIRIEYMDTKRYQDSIYIELFKNYLFKKYNKTRLDLIVTTDNSAFDFINNNPQFRKNVPVVFCGLNYADSIPDEFTGIMEDVDIQANIETILNIHPNYKQINIILDRTVTGEVIYQHTKQVIEAEYPELKYKFIRDFSFRELKNHLNKLDESEIVLLLIFNRDKNGLVIPYDEILDEITPYCHAPIYGVWDFYLNDGIIGGKITSSYYHGLEAGKIATKILAGASVKDFSIAAGPTKYIFDFQILKKYNISRHQLPPDRIIINRPTNVIVENKNIFLLIGLVFLLLLSQIVFLLTKNAKIRHLLDKERIYLEKLEEKQALVESALHESRKASELQRAFFANVSHEIRTPLNGILGFSELIAEDETIEADNRKYLSTIIENGQRLLTMVDNLIDISMIESKMVNLRNEVFNLNELMKGVFDFFNARNNSDSPLKFKLSKSVADSKAFLFTDSGKLEDILRNLLDNAYKFTKEGAIEFGYNYSPEGLLFYVKDTGIGIADKDRDTIFSPFGQVESGHRRNFHGSGLGLSIIKTYAELLGGSIWFDSELGKGSTFYFNLPKQPGTAREMKKLEASAAGI